MSNFTNEIVIRCANAGDLSRMAEIESICFPKSEAAHLEDFQSRFSHFPENFFVAVDKQTDEVVGFINGATNDEPSLPDEMYHDSSLHKKNGQYLTVFGIDVIPSYQKNGIGAKLMNRYIEWAKETHKKGIILTCKDKLVHWYEKFGYKRIGVSSSSHGGSKWNDMHLIF